MSAHLSVEKMSILRDWDQEDLAAFVSLQEIAPHRYRNIYGDPNLNGRAYGGQLIGHAMMAASLSAPAGRDATNLNLLFLKGTDPTRPVEFEVSTLQDGGRFSSRHVRGVQAGHGLVIDAYATFSVAMEGPDHSAPAKPMPGAPEDLPDLVAIPEDLMVRLRALGPYSRHVKPCLDFRVPDLAHQLAPETSSPFLRFWLRARRPLPKCNRTHAAAFAFMSDWWLNFSSMAAHVREMGDDEQLYISSLNHCIWLHRRVLADDWMLFESESPCAAGGRGLSIARVRDRNGKILASLTQESLMTPAKTLTSETVDR